MKICWDNLNKYDLYLTKFGNFRSKYNNRTYYYGTCKNCRGNFISRDKNTIFCSTRCSLLGENHPKYGKQLTDEHKSKISKSLNGKKKPKRTEEHCKKLSLSNRGKKLSEETKERMSKSKKGKDNVFWKGGYHSKDIPTYDTYAHQIDWCEDIRRNVDDPNILEVKCAYCGRWFVPTVIYVRRRIESLKGQITGEQRFYCSYGCKQECPIYRQRLYPKGFKQSTSREVQPQLRQLVLKRDEYTCQKCGNTDHLHCHHILPVSTNPIESADVDNCITLCKKCHKEVHKQDGCKYNELRMCA